MVKVIQICVRCYMTISALEGKSLRTVPLVGYLDESLKVAIPVVLEKHEYIELVVTVLMFPSYFLPVLHAYHKCIYPWCNAYCLYAAEGVGTSKPMT